MALGLGSWASLVGLGVRSGGAGRCRKDGWASCCCPSADWATAGLLVFSTCAHTHLPSGSHHSESVSKLNHESPMEWKCFLWRTPCAPCPAGRKRFGGGGRMRGVGGVRGVGGAVTTATGSFVSGGGVRPSKRSTSMGASRWASSPCARSRADKQGHESRQCLSTPGPLLAS